jgi:hypothetical protein
MTEPPRDPAHRLRADWLPVPLGELARCLLLGLCRPRYAECMMVRELLAELQQLPRDAELLAFEPGCEDYCEREVDDYLAS